jgi:hypothetical protein
MAENTNLALTIEAWAAIVVERWERKIQQLGIYHTGKLINSFTHYVNTQANGNPDKITFAFEYYGKFVDMGVGRGVKLGAIETSTRTAKPWYSKIFWGQFLKIKEIMVEKYQIKSQLTIITSVEQGKV